MNNHVDNSSNEFEQFKNGSTDALQVLFSRYHEALFFYLLKLSGDRMVAASLVTDAFMTIWDRRDHIEDETHFKAYLYITARCKFISQIRKDNTRKKAEQVFASSADTSHNDTYESPEDRERMRIHAAAMLRQAIKKLPVQRRTVIYKLYFEGKKTFQVAMEMGLANQTILNHKAKALKFLRRELTGMEFLLVLAGLSLIRYGL
jgi:RNA polymerase sigma factor (sigma-70 family)